MEEKGYEVSYIWCLWGRSGICGAYVLVCNWTKGVWFECCVGIKIRKKKITTFDKWLMECMVHLKKVGRHYKNIEL